ncbi:MAG: TetR/AcrR family transcriptional regulator [Candidatus Riflebacteria bacterium]
MSRLPATRRGKQTFEKILQGAVESFARKGYHATSVSEICRAAKVANGSFYQYFPDKSDVFEELIFRFKNEFVAALQNVGDVREACEKLFDFFEILGPSFQIFREAEFLDIPHPMENFYRTAIPRLMEILNTGEAQTWAFLGGITMTALFFGVWPKKPIDEKIRDAFYDVATNGIAVGKETGAAAVSFAGRKTVGSQDQLPSGRSERTKTQLVAAARSCFASKGYADTHISHITQLADTAMGTFYVHFNEKREILSLVTREIREQMQSEVIKACTGVSNRIEVERRAFCCFLEYLMVNHDIYRIVREAEFAEPSIGMDYYFQIWKTWSTLLGEAMKKKQVRRADPGVAAAFLMGSESHAGMRWVLWKEDHIPPAEAVENTWKYLCHGLAVSDGKN